MSDYTSVQKQFKYLRIMLNLAAFSILQPDHLISHLFLQEIFIVSLHRVPHSRASPVAQRLKRLPPMWETWVRSLGQEDPLEKEMVTHSSILAWRIPWTEKPGKLQSTGSQGVRHNWETSLSLSLYWVPHSVLGVGGWFSSVQSLCSVWLFETPWTAACQASLSITNPPSLVKFMSIESVMPSSHLILCHPFLLQPSILPSIKFFCFCVCVFVFFFHWAGSSFGWPKYWNFSFSISPSNECSGLISFRIDWLDLLAVQRTLKILLQHHSFKVSILQHSPFFIVQLSHSYMTIGKTIALGVEQWKIPVFMGFKFIFY